MLLCGCAASSRGPYLCPLSLHLHSNALAGITVATAGPPLQVNHSWFYSFSAKGRAQSGRNACHCQEKQSRGGCALFYSRASRAGAEAFESGLKLEPPSPEPRWEGSKKKKKKMSRPYPKHDNQTVSIPLSAS